MTSTGRSFVRTLLSTSWIALCLLVFLGVNSVQAQQEANWWYFGDSAGITFNTNSTQIVEVDTNGSLNTFEGCATISDNSGNLLFYTDGTLVFDANHVQMPNGFDLGGNPSSAQSAIIVPKPQDPGNYYIFSVGNFGDSLFYSEVDLSLGTAGDVVATNKRVFLQDSVHERITAVQSSVGTAYWLLVYDRPSPDLLAYEITTAGVNMTPIVSSVGSPTGFINDAVGYMKANADGDRVAVANWGSDTIELFDFNAATGAFSNPLRWNFGNNQPYGIEFSPSGELLYISRWYGYGTGQVAIHQYDITLGTAATIQASMVNVTANSTLIDGGGALQIGPNEKIYMSGIDYLHVIDSPDVQGMGANYQDSAVFLAGRSGNYGLPTFFPGFFARTPSSTGVCFGDTTFFALDDTTGVDSVLWNFGDPASGIDSTSSDLFPGHVFTDTGQFSVTVTVISSNPADTTTESITVFIFPVPTVDLGPDVGYCQGDSATLNAGTQPLLNYIWDDFTIDSIRVVNAPGSYSISAFNACDTVADTINVFEDLPFTVDIGNDTALCAGQPLTLDATIPNGNYAWTGGTTDPTLTVITAGTWIVTVSNSCDTINDTLVTTLTEIPVAVLGNDTSICGTADSVTLSHPNDPAVNYNWSTISSDSAITVGISGLYWLFASNSCGGTADTIIISFEDSASFEFPSDTTICSDDTIQVSAFGQGGTYLWDNGTTTRTLEIFDDGRYDVTVTIGACNYTDEIAVTTSSLACFSEIDCDIEFPNVFTPNFDFINDFFEPFIDCDLNTYRLRIFNRWGALVFESNAESIHWDGYVAGQPAPEGVYFWTLDFTDDVVIDEDRDNQTGSFTLIR